TKIRSSGRIFFCHVSPKLWRRVPSHHRASTFLFFCPVQALLSSYRWSQKFHGALPRRNSGSVASGSSGPSRPSSNDLQRRKHFNWEEIYNLYPPLSTPRSADRSLLPSSACNRYRLPVGPNSFVQALTSKTSTLPVPPDPPPPLQSLEASVAFPSPKHPLVIITPEQVSRPLADKLETALGTYPFLLSILNLGPRSSQRSLRPYFQEGKTVLEPLVP
ncbi:hypothetical protein AMTR_s00152p00077800, partial [Amborella trichopoda]